jgi:hypothetical protein
VSPYGYSTILTAFIEANAYPFLISQHKKKVSKKDSAKLNGFKKGISLGS